jgi:uncharacterized protein (DUF2147 family)
MRIAVTGVIAVSLLCVAAIGPAAADPVGNWLTKDGEAIVTIAKCGNALCGSIVALKEPNDPATGRPKTDENNPDAAKRNRPVIGVQIIFDMQPGGTADRWNGQVYNPEDGKTYSGSLTVTGANTVDLEGCVFGGLICQGQTWTRTK